MLIGITVCFSYKVEAAGGDFQLQNYMSTELKTLPEYCQVRLTEIQFTKEFTGANGKTIFPPKFNKSLNRWRNSIGPKNWGYFHHYCFGVKDYNTYTFWSYDQRKNKKHIQMKRALEQFEFMRNANLSNFPLWYDLYRYEAMIYSELGNVERAQWAMQQSRKYRKK